jgi:hypothetical protein
MRGREVALKGQSSAELRATSSGMAASEPLLAVHMECTSVTNMIAKKKVDRVLIRRVEMTGADTERRVRPFYCGAGNQYDDQDPKGRHHGNKTGKTKSSLYFARPK